MSDRGESYEGEMFDAEEVAAEEVEVWPLNDSANVSTEVLDIPQDSSVTATGTGLDESFNEAGAGGDGAAASSSDVHSSDEEPLSLSDSDSSDAASVVVDADAPGDMEISDDGGEELDFDDGMSYTEFVPHPTTVDLRIKGHLSVTELCKSHKENMKLINAVKPIEFLYDIGGGKFSKKLREEMDQRWDIVAKRTGFLAADCKALWVHLRNEFRAKLRCYEETSSEVYRSWPYFKQLEFLTPYIHRHRRFNKPGSTPKSKKTKKRLSTKKNSKKKGAAAAARKKGGKSATPKSVTKRQGPPPRKSRVLPAKLQDYVSNDYMSQIEIAEKMAANSSGGSDPSSSSPSSPSSSSNESEGGDMLNGNMERGQGDFGDISDTEKDDAIYVTELSIDGIPTMVIESALTLSEQEEKEILKAAAATGSSVAPSGPDSKVQRVSLNLNQQDSSPEGSEVSNKERSSSRGRKRRPPLKRPYTTSLPDAKKAKLEAGTESEQRIQVTITDLDDLDRVFTQNITYGQARLLNLSGFDLDDWTASKGSNGHSERLKAAEGDSGSQPAAEDKQEARPAVDKPGSQTASSETNATSDAAATESKVVEESPVDAENINIIDADRAVVDETSTVEGQANAAEGEAGAVVDDSTCN